MDNYSEVRDVTPKPPPSITQVKGINLKANKIKKEKNKNSPYLYSG